MQRQKTPDRRPNLSRPYIKLKVYGQTVLLDGGTMAGMGGGAWPDCPPGSASDSSLHPSSPNLLSVYLAMSLLVFQPSSCRLLGSIPKPDSINKWCKLSSITIIIHMPRSCLKVPLCCSCLSNLQLSWLNRVRAAVLLELDEMIHLRQMYSATVISQIHSNHISPDS